MQRRGGGEQLALGHPARAVALARQCRKQSWAEGLRHVDSRGWATCPSGVGRTALLGLTPRRCPLASPLVNRAVF